jgi:hypothetical protein
MVHSISDRQLLNKKQWRAITYNWETLSSYQPIGRLYCLTDFQVAWLQSNVQYMGWSSRWDNCPCTPSELQAMQAELEDRLMSCIDFQPYQLELVYNEALEQSFQRYNDNYDGVLPSSVNSDAPDDFFNGDDSAIRNNALCNAVTVYVYSVLEGWTHKANQVLGIIAVAEFLSAIAGANGIIATVIKQGLGFMTQDYLNATENSEAVQDVICCMRNALSGSATNQTNFENSLNGCGFTAGTDQERVREIIASDLSELDNYLTFINALGNQFLIASAGVSLCDCETLINYVVTFDSLSETDFTVSVDNYYINNPLVNPAIAQSTFGNPSPSPKSAWGGNSVTGTNSMAVGIDILLTQDATINDVTYDYYFTQPSNNVLARQLKLYDVDDNLLGAWNSSNGTPKLSWNNQQFVGINIDNVRTVRVEIAVSIGGASTYANTYGYVDNIQISGVLS